MNVAHRRTHAATEERSHSSAFRSATKWTVISHYSALRGIARVAAIVLDRRSVTWMTHVSGNVKALLHLNKFLVLLGQHFLHGGKRFKSENLVLVFLGRFLCTTLVTLNLQCAQAILTSTWGHD